MADDAVQTETSNGGDAPQTSDLSPKARALALLDESGWGDDIGLEDEQDASQGDEQAPETGDAQEPEKPEENAQEPEDQGEEDELAAIAAKVKKRMQAPKAQPQGPGFDKARFSDDPIPMLIEMGIDPVKFAEQVFDWSQLSREEREAKANARELERYRAQEQKTEEQQAQAAQARQLEEVNKMYLDHVTENADKYPHLAALDADEQLRYTTEVATLLTQAGEEADAHRLAKLTEQRVAKLARKFPGAGTRTQSNQAEAGDRTTSEEGSAPRTITSQLTTESGSPAADFSPEGRKKAALRKLAALGW